MISLAPQRIKQFQVKILSWYEENRRELPWREVPFDTSLGQRDPYKILVSEVMSQQTQLSRVIPKYERWMKELPTIASLAAAKQSTVLRLWSGLGYNRRALYLQQSAQAIVHDYHGVWPKDEKELEKLPGIGKYTAAAVACFAFDKQIPVIDTNVRKVILTQLPIQSSKSKIQNEKEIEEIAWQLLPKGKAYAWNQSLMDYAALMLKKEKIVVPKQSKFIGSNRYYRGKILRLLLEKKRIAKKDLGSLLKDDFNEAENEWLTAILRGLRRDALIKDDILDIFL